MQHNFKETKSQFHYGSIKTEFFMGTRYQWFQSQFHYGSIKTNHGIIYAKQDFRLNSTMVRLKLNKLKKGVFTMKVSIPLWFD